MNKLSTLSRKFRKQWLTLPPSTISFCKSVDAMTSMRMAWRRIGVKHSTYVHMNHEQEHTLSLLDYDNFEHCLKEKKSSPSSDQCSCWGFWKKTSKWDLTKMYTRLKKTIRNQRLSGTDEFRYVEEKRTNLSLTSSFTPDVSFRAWFIIS